MNSEDYGDVMYHVLLAEMISKDPTLQKSLKRFKGNSRPEIEACTEMADAKLKELVKKRKYDFNDCVINSTFAAF